MKKRLTIILAVLIIASFTGCNSGENKTGGDSNPVAADSNNDKAIGDDANRQPGGRNRQQPADAAELTGEVVSVNDREVSLKILEMPGFGGEMPRGDKSGDRPEMASGDGPKMNGVRPDMASGDGRKMNGVRPDMASGNGPKMEINYTGETTTITIPEGISITKMSRGGNNTEQTELAIGDIKEGDILQVWFADKDEGVVERVSISNFGIRE